MQPFSVWMADKIQESLGYLAAEWPLVLFGVLAGSLGFAALRLWLWVGLIGHGRVCVFPGCGWRIKRRFRLCPNHFRAASRYEWELRDEWAARDAKCDAFYVYILELDGGKTLYAGQTRNLMRRLGEHQEGTTKTTAGRDPKLVWFEQHPTRQAAVEREADMKHLIDVQPRAVRRMIETFRRR